MRALRRASPVLCAAVLVLHRMGASALGAEDPPRVDYAIVITGGELLAGAYPDSHTHFLTRTLHPMGLHCVGSVIVDDRKADIEKALRHALEEVGLVIVTGGLGPTDNDITRQTLSSFTGIPLEEHPDVLGAMERRFNTPRDQLRANLRRQAQIPTRGTYLKSAGGTAAGLVFEFGDKVVVALPGPPRELEPMVRDELVPYLIRRFGAHSPGCSLTVRFVGIGQSAIDQALKEHVAVPQEAILTSGFEAGRVDFTFTLPHDTEAERARLESLKQQIDGCLKQNIYAFGSDSLEHVVLARIAARAATLAVADAGSGGVLAACLTGETGAEPIVAGAFVAPSEERLRHLLAVPDDAWQRCESTDDRVRTLASATAARTRSQWAVAAGQPSPGAGGSPSVAVAFRHPDGRIDVQRFELRGSGASARAALVTQVLDALRRHLGDTGEGNPNP